MLEARRWDDMLLCCLILVLVGPPPWMRYPRSDSSMLLQDLAAHSAAWTCSTLVIRGNMSTTECSEY